MDITSIKTVFKISRPLFWIYLAGPFLVGYTAGITNLEEFYSFIFFYGLAYFLVPANLFLYGTNDLSDKDTDKYNPKKTNKENKYKFNQLNLYLTSIFISLLMAIPLFLIGNRLSSLILIAFFVLGFFYSVHPIRFKSKPILDFLSNCLYAIPGLYGYVLTTNKIPDLRYISASFVWCFSMHLFSAIPDIKPDTKAGLQTSAVKLGERKSLLLCSFFWLVTTAILINKSILFIPSIIYPIIPIYTLLKKSNISKIYWMFPFLNFFVGGYLFFLTLHLKGISFFN
ncbi:MAG: prenyltransferase [Patescibacteria group bacterium]|nr:prenyltransferase [Patescibacteria group bacterium]